MVPSALHSGSVGGPTCVRRVERWAELLRCRSAASNEPHRTDEGWAGSTGLLSCQVLEDPLMSTTTRVRRTTRVLPAAALGALLLASCGQGTSSGTAGAPVANAAPVAVSAPATTAPTAAVPSAGAVTVATLAARVKTALEDVRSGTATITVAGTGTPAGSVTIAADAAAPAATITARVAGQTYQVRALDGAVYASGPALQALTGGRTWARVDVTTLAQLAGGVARPTASPTAVPDPTQIAALVAQAVSVRDLGAAQVGGRAGETYRVSLPVAALAQLTSATGLPLDVQQRAQVRKGVDALAAQGVTVLSADLTLDGQDRPLQLTSATPALAGGVPSTKVTAAFSGWGAPVEVTAPPAAQVTVLDAADLTALAGRLVPSAVPSASSTTR